MSERVRKLHHALPPAFNGVELAFRLLANSAPRIAMVNLVRKNNISVYRIISLCLILMLAYSILCLCIFLRATRAASFSTSAEISFSNAFVSHDSVFIPSRLLTYFAVCPDHARRGSSLLPDFSAEEQCPDYCTVKSSPSTRISVCGRHSGPDVSVVWTGVVQWPRRRQGTHLSRQTFTAVVG